MNENNNISLGEKIAFIISFIATLIALYSFNDQLKNVNINLLMGTYSLDNILLLFTLILGTSLYFYALNCIRFDFPALLNIKSLKYLEMGGRLFYFLAIFVYPLSLFILWIINLITIWLAQYIDISIQNSNFLDVSAESLSLAGIALSAYFIYTQSRLTSLIFIEEKLEKLEDATLKANYDFENKKYNYVPIHLYERIIEKLEGVLVKEYGYSVSNVSKARLIRLALERKVLTEKDYAFIHHLRRLRNSIAHDQDSRDLTEEEVRILINKTSAIIRRL